MLSHLKYGAATMVAAWATYGATARILADGVLGLILKAMVCVILPNLIYYLIYFKTKDFKDSRSFLEAVLRKKW